MPVVRSLRQRLQANVVVRGGGLFPVDTSCYCTEHKAQAAWIGSLT
ncbi:hypothetical protein C4K04_3074 [Pseudomonas chlororaphis]|uniref:Uncharacterized protein n=1 Tax=Pseudomonas chlororaphis TaxID=587753 RepID=A0A3G7TR80_9PSED|nr:hypothetical protein C4K04_3074 [Pseudomonas chlororaphis]